MKTLFTIFFLLLCFGMYAQTKEVDSLTADLDEVVISGTLKEVTKADSPVPIEVYSSRFFKANPTASVFEALQNVNGVKPQYNCNVCNTGDIHINGLEGPYTMVLIDGMPMVSGLSTVYGLSGIPQSLINRVEIVKGPASTLYGSEAVGGLINIITNDPDDVASFSADVHSTSWGELNTDLAASFRVGERVKSLVGINYFNYQQPADHNHDHFTDVTLQHRISLFNRWTVARPHDRIFSVAGRLVYEDRWGGEMSWDKTHRGGDEVYGESIYTKRWELFGTYQLPVEEPFIFTFSTTGHDQNSVYGDMPYIADQFVGFGQLTWNRQWGQHDFLSGLSYRYTYYNDNTTATTGQNQFARYTHLPGLFIQDEIALNDQNRVLAGIRYDYNSIHGSILSPRLNYKWNAKDERSIFRLSLGNGYRVANVFTEDHAALTGARDVIFTEELEPETSYNANVNYVRKFFIGNHAVLGVDMSAFYTYFDNKIVADYEYDPNLIVYDNLRGHAVSKGLSFNVDLAVRNGLKLLLGATAMDVYQEEDDVRTRQLFTERFSGVWTIGYRIPGIDLSVDYTGNLYSPMRLPLLNERDPRRKFSPWFSIQNIQLSRSFSNGMEIYAGIKNLLNWTPNRGNPFIIARSNDPFDRHPEVDNPYNLTFDPTYVFGPNQGRRTFLGLRYSLF